MEEKTLRLDQKAFCCPICLSLPQDPVTVECGHSYCRGCVTGHWDQEQRQRRNTGYTCPMCRQSFPQRPALVKSTMLVFLLDELQKPPPPTAAEKSLTEKFAEQQDLINQIQSKESDLFLLRLKQTQINASGSAALSSLRSQFTSVEQLLKSKRTDLDGHITTRLHRNTAQIQQLLIPLEAEVSQLRSALNRLDPQAVVPKHQATPESSGKWSLFDQTKRATDDFLSKLTTTITDGMAPVNAALGQIKTVLPTMRAEPRNRAELLRYFNPISLDLATAHSFLELSGEKKQVKFTGVNQQYPENPLRFSEHWQILNKVPLSGQRYFEVKWQITGQLRLAIVDTNLLRKDPVKGLFGNSKRCWALHCDNSRFSLWSEGKELSLAGHLTNKVGVYVNTDSGALCFYGVSPSTGAILLHRVQAEFRGPVYVGLGFYLSSVGDTASFCPLP